MKLKAVKNIILLEKIIEEHSFKETLTNNYILLEGFTKYIYEKKLWFWKGNSNLYLFVEKEGFYRLYYLINNIDAVDDFSNLQIVFEVIYRGKNKMPLKHIKYWKKNSFYSHLTRDCYFLNAVSISPNFNKVEGVTIEPPKNKEDILFAKKLIDENLDLHTGDRLSLQEIENFVSRGLLFCAYKNDTMCGMLQADLRNNIYWLSHIVVDKDYRGMGLANLLVDNYLNEGLKLQVKQFQLWVIEDNIPAVKLYKKRGFAYLNKSTHSMLSIHS
jgi:GNAT superfamily N-acetyltransferase